MSTSFVYYNGTNFQINYSNSTFKIKRNELDYINGLIGTRYIGYHGDDPSWFNTASMHGDTNTLTSINSFSSSPDLSQQEYYSWQWLGYFKPSTTENYTFYTSSDDGSYLWIGDNAVSGYTTTNALVNNGGPHGNSEVSNTIELIAGIYYPIRIQFGEIGGGDVITVSFSTNTIQKTTDGTGFYFSIP